MKAIISGGGTGGHIFPALAIAAALKRRHPEADILFVGARGRMEMEKVPAAGYPIKGLPIAGLQRQLTLSNIIKNLQLPFKMLHSRVLVRRILRQFSPDIVVGVGGFASQPTLSTAQRMGLPTLLQEQNSYAGLTNKTLARGADRICVAYPDMERFFPADKLVLTGNPVRADIEQLSCTRDEGCAHFQLDPSLPVILSVGGSLGARSINRMVMDNLQLFAQQRVQIIFQTGGAMHNEARQAVERAGLGQWVKVHPFISRMDLAYAAADLVISRAGALAISELCLLGKPALLIPSPNVAEDHQTRNAKALADKGAAIMLTDAECHDKGLPQAFDLLHNPERCAAMSQAILTLAAPHAADRIVDEIDAILVRNHVIDSATETK